MTAQLDGLALDNARDLKGRDVDVWVRRVLLVVFAVLPVLALLNVFGQSPGQASTSTAVAKLTVLTPTHLRGGLLYESRFTIQARQAIKNATLSLDNGWANGLTINTLEPSPSQETSSNGDLSFQLGSLSPGDIFVLHMAFQVNPTTVGSRQQRVTLLDGSTPLLTVNQHVTVYP